MEMLSEHITTLSKKYNLSYKFTAGLWYHLKRPSMIRFENQYLKLRKER